jgi:hypothetical protein
VCESARTALAGVSDNPEGLQSRRLVHFSAERREIMGSTLPENMYLTPSALTLHFSFRHPPQIDISGVGR